MTGGIVKGFQHRILRRNRSIRTRMIMIISTSTLFVFLVFAIVYNAALMQYIRSSAVSQLNDTLGLLNTAVGMSSEYGSESTRIIAHIESSPRGNYRIQPSAFEVNKNYETLNVITPTEMQKEIVEGLKNSGKRLEDTDNVNIRGRNGNYYVSVHALETREGIDSRYLIVYVDVTGLTNFAANINVFFFYLVSSIWLLSVSLAVLLTGSIAKPIRQICMFAARIGKGDFSQSKISYVDTELDELNTIMNQTARQLEVYDKDQKTFFQNASHELRTPLMSIKCFAEGIEYGVMEPAEASRTILSETDKMTDMVEDLLYLSRIDNITTSFSTNDADIRQIVISCADRQKSVAKSKQIEFVFDMDSEPVILNCNERLISRALTNLIANAIRYAYSEITLTCRKGETKATIGVSDDGAGIDAADLPHIFERFYKGRNGNHGIGLSIVKSITEQHYGTLTAENSKKGASFTIELPLNVKK